MLHCGLGQQRLFLLQQRYHRRVVLVAHHALEVGAGFSGELAHVIERADYGQVAPDCSGIVLRAVAGSSVHAAGTGLQVHIVGQHHRGVAAVQRMDS